MKKRLFPFLTLLVVLTVLISACSQKLEYTNVIPRDANVVMTIRMKSLAEKAGFNDETNETARQKLKDMLKSGLSASGFQQIEKIVEEPEKAGIDVNVPIYLFSSPALPYIALVSKVSNKNDLQTLLETLEKEKLCSPIEKADNYEYTEIGKQALLAFNSSALLCVAYNNISQSENIKQAIVPLFKQDVKNSICSTPIFEKLQKSKGDISLFFSSTSIPETYRKLTGSVLPRSNSQNDLSILSNLSFENGKIRMECEYLTQNAETQKAIEKYSNAMRPINNTFLAYFPQSTLVVFSMGINGEKLYDALQGNEEFQSLFSNPQSSNIKNIFNALQGDLTIGLTGVSPYGSPEFLAYANIKNKSAIEQLYERKSELGLNAGEDIIKLGNDEYAFKSPEINFFFGFRNDALYITNNKQLYQTNKMEAPSALNTEYAPEIKGKRAVLIINMESVLNIPFVKVMVAYGGPEYTAYHSLANKIAYIKTSIDSQNIEMTLQLKNKDINALKQIVDFIKEFAGI
ncbi:MAG: DUF4836 family protein [Bacteroides sp.]|jgi:hypothetical protein|nr:DUF4836 family protein [Bacteroides sp.]